MNNKSVKEKWVIGIDEAGRGPLAGPVAVGLCAIKCELDQSFLNGIRDSKKLSEKKREEWYELLINKQKKAGIIFKAMLISPQQIDSKGIAVVIREGVAKLLKEFPDDSKILLDGSLKAPECFHFQETIIRGDDIEPLISAASVCAKVTRDAYMKKISKKFPEYDFHLHKGYGTKKHRDLIKSHGISSEHRKSYCRNVLSEK